MKTDDSSYTTEGNLILLRPTTEISCVTPIDIAKFAATGGKVAVLIRHSRRFPINSGNWGNDVPLTEKGREYARQLGGSFLPFRFNKWISSPVGRCVDTCIQTAAGMDINLLDSDVEKISCLGEPGAFIEEDFYNEMNPDIFWSSCLNFMKTGDEHGFKPLHEGCTDILEVIENKMMEGPLFVCTHDFIAGCMRRFLSFPKLPIPNYLEGIAFFGDENGVKSWHIFRGLDHIVQTPGY